MGTDDVAALYDSLSLEWQAYFLASLVHELTISVRDYYGDGPQVVNSRGGSAVGGLNEAQHQAAGHLVDVLAGRPGRAPGADVVASVLGWANSGGARAAAEYALRRAAVRTEGCRAGAYD